VSGAARGPGGATARARHARGSQTGSGVLAIAAARLGFRPVVAIDNEQDSVAAARANAAANGVQLDLRHADGLAYAASWPHAREAVLVANLLRPTLLELARTMPTAPRDLLVGGLLAEQADEAATAFREQLGLRQRAFREGAGWVALWLSPS